MKMTRRTVLTGLGAGALLGGLGGRLIRPARATTGSIAGAGLTGGPYKVLEIFLAGALSHQETIWMTSEAGPSWSSHRDASAWSDLPCDAGDVAEIGADDAGNPVYLGGMCAPLAGWLDSTRVVALGHEQPAHAAAIPFALGGSSLGRPTRAGLGAAIGRYIDETSGGSPASFVLHGGSRAVARHALVTGLHGNTYRPIELALGSDGARVVSQLVARGGESYRAGLLDVFGARYDQRLTSPLGARVRSVVFDDHNAARRQLGQAGGWAGGLQTLTASTPMAYDSTHTWPDAAGGETDGYITRAIALAVGLLNDASGPGARHVCVVDDGAGDATNYDSHAAQHDDMSDAFQRQAGQLWWVLDALTAAYGATPPTDTLIVVHTEFGRDQVQATGTEHHTQGYAAMLIGGPVAGGVGGAMAGGVTQQISGAYPGPAELHGAILYAAGIDPTHADCFGADGMLYGTDTAALLAYVLGV